MSKQTDLINVTDAMTVSGSNVGIGTSSPSAKLSIVGAGNGTSFSNTTASTAYNQATVVGNAGGSVKVGVDNNIGTAFNSGNYGGSIQSTNNLAFSAGGAERMRIDSSGRVTMPYQPSFQAWSNSGGNEHFAGGTNPSFLTISSNVGNHFNGTTFTAPVSGRYLFFYTILSGTSGNYGLIALNVNGGPAVGNKNWTQHYTTTTNDQQNSGQQILTLSANDQVNLYIHPTHNRFYWNNAYSKFGGHLIG